MAMQPAPQPRWMRWVDSRLPIFGSMAHFNAYPTPTGGFVYVGSPRYDTPLEADLAHLFEVAERAGIVWLKFDQHGTVVIGIETFGELEPAS